jgi:hypothetical protein
MPPKIPTTDDEPLTPVAVPDATDLTRSEQPGGTEEMPSSPRARKQRDDSNSSRDSNDLGSGVST